ncbi:MAG TPA: pyridoxal phosphate-dependent aminotransferase [Clostridiales bacterium]|nr:pyridoxal phosphate-dependent aminotransferase [Clostridiales bacterium]
MISQDVSLMVKNSSAIRALFEDGKRLASQYGSENVFDYSIGNPNFPAPEAVKKAVIDIISNEDSLLVHGYMPNSGFPDVRAAVASWINKTHGTSFTAENIVMTVGASGGLNVIFRTLLNPGDEVIVTSPYFFEYGSYVKNWHGELVVVPTKAEDGFMPDVDAIAAAINKNTKALILNNPNNPSGVVYPAEMIEKIAAMLEKKQAEFGSPIYIIADEPYRELAYDGVQVPYIPNFYRNTIVCYSWSKSLSLPGERVGYLAVHPDADDSQLIFDGAVVSNRTLGFINCPSLIQRVVMRCLDEKTDISGYDHNRRLLYNGLRELGFECAYPSGAFYLWVKSPLADEKAFVEAARKRLLLLVPGTSFGTPGYVRIAYCVSPDMIKRSMPAFAALAKDCGM